MMENTSVKTVNTAVMSVCTEEMTVNSQHQESRSVTPVSRRLLPNSVVNLASMMGWSVNKTEMLGCILGYLDCSLDFVESN